MLLHFPYTLLNFLTPILYLILFGKYILSTTSMRDIIIFLLLRISNLFFGGIGF
jgi:hypothetical protein